jgi:aminopeptidase YwaD
MASKPLTAKADTYLQKLCLDIPNRRVGSSGNRAATDFFVEIVESFGFESESTPFECIDWSEGGAQLTAGGIQFDSFVSPYSLGCCVSAPLVVISSVKELEAQDFSDKIVLLRGDLTREQLMPKNFPFYNPDHHKQIIHLLETKEPLAIVAATSRNPELAGGIYPFPLIEDGDFDIPSVYMTEEEGDRLARYEGIVISLDAEATRTPATGCNITARKGENPAHRVVVFAHIDAKINSPGAIDNATGVVVLLLLAELLADFSGNLTIELVALNGEDYYAASGEILFVNQNEGRFAEILFGINIDAAGYQLGPTAYSLYHSPPEIADLVHQAFSPQRGFVEGPQWYQSDHSLFIQNQVPALAITSDRFMDLSTHITHTPKDHPEIVDLLRLMTIAYALKDLLRNLNLLEVRS